MREILNAEELALVAGGDPLAIWAGQGSIGERARAWYSGEAVVVAVPDLSRRDRLAMRGPVEELAPLVEQVLAEVGPSFRPFGDEELIRELVERVPGMSFVAAFGWMVTDELPSQTATAVWLEGDSGVEELLTEASPGSWAWPGGSGVLRWAAATSDSGELLSIGADAWSAPEVGFLAGVATRPTARGRGLSQQVCGFVTAELVKRHGTCALMVESKNAAAISVYNKLGYTYRAVAAAAV